jgi:hypothetical protein
MNRADEKKGISEKAEEQRQEGRWTLRKLTELHDLLLYQFNIPFAITTKETSASFGSDASEWFSYGGFIPHEGLDDVYFAITSSDSVEDEYRGYLGYIEVLNGSIDKHWQVDDFREKNVPMIRGFIRKGSFFFETVNKMLTESKIFNSKISATLDIDDLQHFQSLQAEELLGQKLLIKSISIDGSVFCPAWDHLREAKRDKFPPKNTIRSYLSYAWEVLINAVIVFVAFYLFTLTSTSFEIVLLAVLVLLYAEVRYSKIASMTFFLKGEEQYIHLLQVLDDPLLKGEDMHDTFSENEKLLKKEKTKMFIVAFFLGILCLLAFWKILNSVLL